MALSCVMREVDEKPMGSLSLALSQNFTISRFHDFTISRFHNFIRLPSAEQKKVTQIPLMTKILEPRTALRCFYCFARNQSNKIKIFGLSPEIREPFLAQKICVIRAICVPFSVPQEAANLLNLFNHREAVC